MATKRAKQAKPKAGPGRHKLLIVAITLFWAAANEPEMLGLGPIITWLLTALAVALLASALLALAEPALLVVLRLFSRRQLQAAKQADEPP